jgi:hypothetical protein
MITEANLQELLNIKAEQPILTIYLNTDPSSSNGDAYKLELRTMLKQVDMPADVSTIENYFSREFDWIGRSVAIFSCAAQGFFRAYSLAIPVRSRIRVGSHSPYQAGWGFRSRGDARWDGGSNQLHRRNCRTEYARCGQFCRPLF